MKAQPAAAPIRQFIEEQMENAGFTLNRGRRIQDRRMYFKGSVCGKHVIAFDPLDSDWCVRDWPGRKADNVEESKLDREWARFKSATKTRRNVTMRRPLDVPLRLQFTEQELRDSMQQIIEHAKVLDRI